MNIFPLHQGDRKPNLFGLLTSRFLYRGPNQPEHHTPHDQVSSAAQETRESLEAYAKRLRTAIKLYNDKYGEEPDEGADERIQYEKLKLNFKKLPTLKAHIVSIQNDIVANLGTESIKNNQQYKHLDAIFRVITSFERRVSRRPEVIREARRGRLRERHELMTTALETKKAWAKKPIHGELSRLFDRVKGDKDFKDVWESPDGLQLPAQREARELFMAIMAEKTNGFEDRFVLGKEFGDDAAANIRNFPYIYNEFLKIEGAALTGQSVSAEAIASAQSEVNSRRSNLGRRTAQEICNANPAAGLRPVPPEGKIPDTPAWKKRHTDLVFNYESMKEKARTETDIARRTGWNESADELKQHVEYARACLNLSKLKDREKRVENAFTRKVLNQPKYRKTVMELVMKKFVKSMDMVDNLYGVANHRGTLHPTVRRMMIASIYDTGVARYQKNAEGEVTYEENVKKENEWMFSALALSDYFNFKEKGERMDEDHIALLKAAWLASKISIVVNQMGEGEEVLQAWIDVKEEAEKYTDKDDPKLKEFIEKKMARFPKHLVERFSEGYDEDKLKSTLDQVGQNKARLVEFLERARKAIANPYANDPKKPEGDSQQFIADMKSGQYAEALEKSVDDLGKLGIIDEVSFKGYTTKMRNLQINFMTQELQEGNMLKYFKLLGMNIEGLYQKYLPMIKKNPKLRADYWDHMLLGTDAEFKQLIDFFKVVIPTSDAGGKEDFIAGLIAIRRKYKGKTTLTEAMASMEEGSEDAIVLNTFRMLKLHLGDRAATAASSDLKQAEIDEKLRGVHIGDKISKYVGGVWDMLAGPGQSSANRVAGFILMYGFYKSARAAMKGEGKYGKAMRALFVAGAVEIAAKEITGRGILDRAGLDSIAGAMEGTYEEVLRQDAEEHMDDKEITPEAHGAALHELNGVPFHEIMAWYESSDPNGMPLDAKADGTGGTDLFPKQIDLKLIAPKVTWAKKNKELEARRVVYKTVKHFFGYVGEKGNFRDSDEGRRELKERWINMVPGNREYKKDYAPKHTGYHHKDWIEAAGIRQKDVTWQMVMRAEIDPKEVDLTKNKTHTGILTATAKEWYEDIAKWSREHVYNPGSGHAEVFFDALGENAASAKDFLGEVAEDTGRKVYFGKEKVVLWYGQHKYEIRRSLENHWELLVTGLAMPFKVILTVDDWAIPWTLSKLKQIEESLRTRRMDVISDRDDMTANDIIRRQNLPHLGSSNLTLNPQFKNYGIYQRPFLDAYAPYRRQPDRTRQREVAPRGNWFHIDKGQNVGYFISEVNYADAKIDTSNPLYASQEQRNAAMLIASRKKAKQKYRNHGMSFEEIDKYMYAIHEKVFTKSGKMYVFWRMPLQHSAELYLKESGRWADYMDPNKHRDREHFEVDPSQTSWQNIRRAFSLDMDGTRRVLASAGGYVAQVPRFMMWNFEVLADIVKHVGGAAGASNEFEEAVENTKPSEDRKQSVDEFFTSGKSKYKALSEFYKDETNAKLYKFALDCAHQTNQPLQLGFMEGREGYKGTLYMETSSDDYARMWEYYRDHYVPMNNGKTDPDIEKQLSTKMPKPY